MKRSAAFPDPLVREVARECARAQDPLDLLEHVAAKVRTAVPYSNAGWILVDPDTMLMNGVYGEGVDRETHLALIEAEMSDEADFSKFVELAAARVPAVALSAATGGTLARSSRWRTVYQPRGYGDELRAAFTSGSTTWGHACLIRRADEPAYTAGEVALLTRICPYVADGIRTGLAVCGPSPAVAGEEPAVVVLSDDGPVESMTPAVPDWFGDPADESLRTTIVLHQVARRARLLADEHTGERDAPPARAWARTAAGDSVVVRGARLPEHGRTVLVLDAATRSDLAPLVMELHRLTQREREVTQLLLTGRSTQDIAATLWITPETLRGHVKNVLAKLEVSSRAELFALLSREPRSRLRPAVPASPHSQ